MTETIAPISAAEFQGADGLEDWRVLGDGACIHYRVSSFADAAALVAAIGALPGVDEHPPAIDIRDRGVTVRLVTAGDEYFGMTRADVEVARRITAAAQSLGLRADASGLQSFIVIPGAPAGTDVKPFWRAVLGYEPRPDSPDEDLVDPQDRGPGFWFESMDEPRPDGGGAIHIAVWVPHELARARVEAALAAGGRLVRDDFAPAWWTLADAAGNEADVASITGRD